MKILKIRLTSVVLFCLVLFMPISAIGADTPSLKGAKTLQVIFKIFSEQECEVEKEKVEKQVYMELERSSVLKIKMYDPGKYGVPDLVATYHLDASYLSLPNQIQRCQFVVNLRVISPFLGHLTYNSSPRVIQALIFNKSIFSVISPKSLTEDTISQLNKLTVLFLDKYRSDNLLKK